MQTRTRQVQLAIQKAAANARKTITAVRSVIRNFLYQLAQPSCSHRHRYQRGTQHHYRHQPCGVCLRSRLTVSFCRRCPNAASVTVREAVDTLTAEYRDRLEEISDTVQHDHQDITANDDVYYIRWQDVLAVFSSYVAGSEQGAPVAALTEEQVDKLREIMWAMNALDYSTHPETTTIDTTDEDGNPTTTEITETVLVIELTQ